MKLNATLTRRVRHQTARGACGLLCLVLSSCVVATKDTYVSLGGKSAYRSATFGVVHDHNKSFRDGTLAAALIAGSYYSAATAAAKEVTSQVATKEATKTAINSSNNAAAVSIETIKAGVATEAIKAGAAP